MSGDTNAELESFRRKWHEEVIARNKEGGSQHRAKPFPTKKSRRDEESLVKPRSGAEPHIYEEEGLVEERYDFDNIEAQEEARRLGLGGSGVHPESRRGKEPVTALDHYEQAVEKETQGHLGDSLSHYRKAYRVVLLIFDSQAMY